MSDKSPILQYHCEPAPRSGERGVAALLSVAFALIASGLAVFGGAMGLILSAPTFCVGASTAIFAVSQRHPLRALAIVALILNAGGAASIAAFVGMVVLTITCC